MFILKIKDSLGVEINLGDLVEIQDKRNFHRIGNLSNKVTGPGLTFWTRVQIIKGQVYPFNKFVFDRIIKVDSLPEGLDIQHCPAKEEQGMPEYWISSEAEAKLIEEDKLHRWKIDCLSFNHNDFYTVEELNK